MSFPLTQLSPLLIILKNKKKQRNKKASLHFSSIAHYMHEASEAFLSLAFISVHTYVPWLMHIRFPSPPPPFVSTCLWYWPVAPRACICIHVTLQNVQRCRNPFFRENFCIEISKIINLFFLWFGRKERKKKKWMVQLFLGGDERQSNTEAHLCSSFFKELTAAAQPSPAPLQKFRTK